MLNNIGNTNLVTISSLSEEFGCTIQAKLEFQNPGKSSKDRPALYMIESAINDGRIKEDTLVVEASSGNTAIGIALVCKAKGLKCHFFISTKCSSEKKSYLTSLGATYTICEKSNNVISGLSATIDQAQLFADENPDVFFCNQYFNPANALAHFETTGPEIWEQSKGRVTHFVAGLGTCGTITGVSKFLKSKNHKLCVLGIEPEGSLLQSYKRYGELKTEYYKPYITEGIGREFIPGNLEIEIIDEIIQVSDHEAVESSHNYLEVEGFHLGFSSASVVAGLRKMAPMLSSDSHVVLLYADHGLRYMSKLYNQTWLEKVIEKV